MHRYAKTVSEKHPTHFGSYRMCQRPRVCCWLHPAVTFNSTMNHTGLYLRPTNEGADTQTQASFSPEPSRSRCVCDKECTSSVELGKSHSETDRCLTLSDSRSHLRCRSAALGTRRYTRGVCVRMPVDSTRLCQRQGGAETDPRCTGPIRRITAAAQLKWTL